MASGDRSSSSFETRDNVRNAMAIVGASRSIFYQCVAPRTPSAFTTPVPPPFVTNAHCASTGEFRIGVPSKTEGWAFPNRTMQDFGPYVNTSAS